MCFFNLHDCTFKEYLSVTDPYGSFSAYHVALADGLLYRQLFMYFQRYT